MYRAPAVSSIKGVKVRDRDGITAIVRVDHTAVGDDGRDQSAECHNGRCSGQEGEARSHCLVLLFVLGFGGVAGEYCEMLFL